MTTRLRVTDKYVIDSSWVGREDLTLITEEDGRGVWVWANVPDWGQAVFRVDEVEPVDEPIRDLRKQVVVLEITYDACEHVGPEHWNWPVVLDNPDGVTMLAIGPIQEVTNG